jgi:hypothetical protein
MPAHWYDDGYIVAIPVVLIFWPAFAWVMICRPAWAIKIWGPMVLGGLTPQRSRRWGIRMLVSGAAILVWLVYRVVSRSS